MEVHLRMPADCFYRPDGRSNARNNRTQSSTSPCRGTYDLIFSDRSTESPTMSEQPESPRRPKLSKVVTFYSDVSDELDSHFSRALSANDIASCDADQPSKVNCGVEARECGKTLLAEYTMYFCCNGCCRFVLLVTMQHWAAT